MPRATTAPPLELDRIRRAIVLALFSDDTLFHRLALKGGNALRLVYNVQQRASLDLDLSLEGDLDDFDATRQRLLRLLRERLDAAGYVVFDEDFLRRPPDATGRWGGYLLEFKLIAHRDYERLRGDLEALRRGAVAFSASQLRKWRVEISKFEFCDGKIPLELDDQTIHVYSPEMIVLEKLRALCQQLTSYPARTHPTPRARDFYDIHEVVRRLVPAERLEQCADLARAIFAAKDVPLVLLRELRGARDFHASDWPDVTATIRGEPGTFDHYFDFVVDLAERLEALWAEDPPAGDEDVLPEPVA